MMRETSETRKEQIVQAAMEILATGGLVNLTMQKIGDAIGITDAAIYKHFSGKQEILLTMIASIRKHLLAFIRDHIDREAPPLDQLRDVLRYHLQYIEDQNGTPHLLFSEALYTSNPQVKESIRKTMGQYIDFLREILRRGQAEGQLRSDLDVASVPVALLGVIQSSVMLWVLSGTQYPLASNADSIWDIFERGLT